jgi:hypothetical protein
MHLRRCGETEKLAGYASSYKDHVHSITALKRGHSDRICNGIGTRSQRPHLQRHPASEPGHSDRICNVIRHRRPVTATAFATSWASEPGHSDRICNVIRHRNPVTATAFATSYGIGTRSQRPHLQCHTASEPGHSDRICNLIQASEPGQSDRICNVIRHRNPVTATAFAMSYGIGTRSQRPHLQCHTASEPGHSDRICNLIQASEPGQSDRICNVIPASEHGPCWSWRSLRAWRPGGRRRIPGVSPPSKPAPPDSTSTDSPTQK